MRIRSIKPEFWRSEAIARLPWSARLLFIALWSYVDDNGVGRDNEKLIVADVFPLEDDPRETLATVSRDLRTLAEAGRIVRYTADGRALLAVVNFSEHQKIDKPNKPRYPGPDAAEPPLTCESRDSRETLATVSPQSRETPPPGAGEQRSRGTEEQGKKTLARQEPGGFDAWWDVYPRKVGKRAARAAYDRACRRTGPDVILTATELYRDDLNRDPAFTPHPTTWLNRDGWWDEPCPPREQQHPNPAEERDRRHLALIEHFSPDRQGEIA